jgi:hypothetical protein
MPAMPDATLIIPQDDGLSSWRWGDREAGSWLWCNPLIFHGSIAEHGIGAIGNSPHVLIGRDVCRPT